jgi:hypothetical protein
VEDDGLCCRRRAFGANHVTIDLLDTLELLRRIRAVAVSRANGAADST